MVEKRLADQAWCPAPARPMMIAGHRTGALREEGGQRQEGKDQHRQHTSGIGVHALAVNKQTRQVAAEDRQHGDDGVEREDQRNAHARAGRVAVLVREVGRSPEEVEPPHAVGKELADDERPGLPVGEALPEGDDLLGLLLRAPGRCGGIRGVILMDVGQLGLVDVLRLLGLLVHEEPEAHPEEAQGTDDQEGHLPAAADTLILEVLRKQRNRGRSDQCTYRRTGVEDRRGEGAVLLREIFGGHLDGGGEVARLTEGEDAARRQEEPDTRRSDGQRHGGTRLDRSHGLDRLEAFDVHRGPAADGVQAGAGRPYADGPQVALLGAHPVDETAGEEHADGIDEREDGRDRAVVGIGPVKFGSNEVFPGQRQHLTIQVVDRGGDEQQHAHPPPPVGHQACRGR